MTTHNPTDLSQKPNPRWSGEHWASWFHMQLGYQITDSTDNEDEAKKFIEGMRSKQDLGEINPFVCSEATFKKLSFACKP